VVKSKRFTRAKKDASHRIVLANWGRRAIAWFVDYLILNLMLGYFGIENIEMSLVPSFLLPRVSGANISFWSPLSVLVFFLYWTFSEWYLGRSMGQLLLNLQLVDVDGKNPSLKAAAIQSVGKSLLLPLDCLAGWVYKPCRRNRQRLFNRLSNTIVIFIGESNRTIKHGDYLAEP